MARIFISHALRDERFARQLARDLQAVGHATWLTEQEIHVGDPMTAAVPDGLETAEFIIVVLSPHAEVAAWVDDELSPGHRRLLPALIESCDVPRCLREVRCADFRGRYEEGFSQLLQVLGAPALLSEPRSRFE